MDMNSDRFSRVKEGAQAKSLQNDKKMNENKNGARKGGQE